MLHQESQHTEWKETWRDDYLRWMCGFANAQGGRLLLLAGPTRPHLG